MVLESETVHRGERASIKQKLNTYRDRHRSSDTFPSSRHVKPATGVRELRLPTMLRKVKLLLLSKHKSSGRGRSRSSETASLSGVRVEPPLHLPLVPDEPQTSSEAGATRRIPLSDPDATNGSKNAPDIIKTLEPEPTRQDPGHSPRVISGQKQDSGGAKERSGSHESRDVPDRALSPEAELLYRCPFNKHSSTDFEACAHVLIPNIPCLLVHLRTAHGQYDMHPEGSPVSPYQTLTSKVYDADTSDETNIKIYNEIYKAISGTNTPLPGSQIRSLAPWSITLARFSSASFNSHEARESAWIQLTSELILKATRADSSSQSIKLPPQPPQPVSEKPLLPDSALEVPIQITVTDTEPYDSLVSTPEIHHSPDPENSPAPAVGVNTQNIVAPTSTLNIEAGESSNRLSLLSAAQVPRDPPGQIPRGGDLPIELIHMFATDHLVTQEFNLWVPEPLITLQSPHAQAPSVVSRASTRITDSDIQDMGSYKSYLHQVDNSQDNALCLTGSQMNDLLLGVGHALPLAEDRPVSHISLSLSLGPVQRSSGHSSISLPGKVSNR